VPTTNKQHHVRFWTQGPCSSGHHHRRATRLAGSFACWALAASSLAVLHSGFANADARFGFPTEIDTSDGTIQEVQFADIDGDGDPDLISNAYLDSTISWYENRDDGTFSTRQVINTNTAQAEEVHPADVDGDGDLDLVVYKAGEDRIVWYSNTGSGFHADTNQPGISIATTPNESMSLAVADLDVDGDVDVIMASIANSAISWFENPGSGGDWSPHSIATSFPDWGWRRVTAADVDRDGDDDLVAVHRDVESNGTLAWHENDGTGLFGNSHIIGEVPYNTPFVAADLDSDDDLDFAAFTGNNGFDLSWFRNEGASEAWTEHYAADLVIPRSLQASDLNNDGAVDLLVGESSSVRWFSNLGSGNFSAGQEIASTGSHDLATADIDSDGDLDVASADYPSGSVLTYLNWGISPGYRTAVEPFSSDFESKVPNAHSFAIGKDGDTVIVLTSLQASDGSFSRADIWGLSEEALWRAEPGCFQSFVQDDYFGSAVAVHLPSERVAIGARDRVEVFERIGSSWTDEGCWVSVAEPIPLVSRESSAVARSIAFSEDGTRIAIGHVGDSSGNDLGTVVIFEWDASTADWVQVGDGIQGNHLESFGTSVAISADGNRVLAGGDFLGNFAFSKGVARVYELNPATSTWVQVGVDFEGQRDGDQFGAGVAMSADGNRIAIGAPGYDGANANEGLVQVYDLADSQWDLVGQLPGGGGSVELTSDGNRLASSSWYRRPVIYDWDTTASTWRQLTLERSDSYIPLSGNVALSHDGDILAVGTGSGVGPPVYINAVQDSVFIDFFDANGTFMGRQFGEGRSEVTAAVTPPVREGYTFAGWAAQPDGSGSAYSADENVRMPRSGKLDLYAQWDINTVYLSYNPQGGTGEPADQTGDAATTITISTTQPTRTGYTFTGWNTRADGTGTNYNANDTYTLPQSGTNTLYAQWRLAAHGFTDVPTAGWQNDAVVWMKTSGVTTGCGTETFCPDVAMTREQQVTFLYRYGGEPDPGNVNPFSDVARGRYFSEAIDWAYNSGITTGYAGTGRFGTGDHVTRAQAVTMLWRQAGQPSPSGVSPFIDVERGRYFTDAVAWAFEAGVTTGTSSTTFSPGDPVTRVQFAAFLSRFDRLD